MGIRIKSIDFLRGQVMVFMALDHVRDFFHLGSFFRDPLNLSTTTALLFFTRWITHFCAPVFVFLAGLSSFLSVQKSESRIKGAFFLFTRGVFLVVLELSIINFAWTFDRGGSFQMLQVIWAIGVSMMVLSLVVFLPSPCFPILGILITAGHNLLDSIRFSGRDPVSLLWYTLHQNSSITSSRGTLIDFTYPVLPWIGIMFLGYSFGSLYRENYSAEKRQVILLLTGFCMILLFVLLRFLNVYGDPSPWSGSFFSFLKTEKYPPSLLFSLMTLGPALIFLALTENRTGIYSGVMTVFGKVPLFYYILHLYLIHFLALLLLVVTGGNWRDMILTNETFRTASLYNYGYNLAVVYAVWILVLLLLYPFCKWYGQYKNGHRDKLWLKFL